MRALIVDDSQFIREYLQNMLEQMGVACEQAADGQEALHKLERDSQYDLMFCDVNMPVMNGLQCVKAVREQKLQPHMRVMMVTTETDKKAIEQALECGADEFLMKPFTVQGVRDKLLLMGVAANR